MDKLLTTLQAYKAMQNFLEDYYYQTLSDDLGSLLGSMQLFPEGGTFDPAMWNEWIDAIGKDKKLTIIEAFNAMRKFLENYYSYIDSEDIKNLINCMEKLPDGEYNKTILIQWNKAVDIALKNQPLNF